ncbi:amidohydrolase [Segniliparus rotundus DSM 44985]|uniref:Amidohydrolase n=1 Tax=Segniliparus rotundus (strain ATCC BAA-972 / CDC 1076 / CIP 108378 / DSM 44985 / JCM 13578) TaxID=640132 RepID=D6Z8Q1_SEGRD|nr:amidohydrolase family protein [Segniliparus rotundus]ADG98331.1 amidohydrolase [Segniliparus rotundus DSM 44985]
MPSFDLVIRNGLVFDGSGAPGVRCDVGVKDGNIAALSVEPLAAAGARTVDATGKWVLPGFIDVHTHYDAEVFAGTGLGESVRHGVTTVLYGNCSMSAVYVEPDDAADLFARVEALPWDAVHGLLKEHKDWTGPKSYRRAVERLPLGCNVATMIGHSDIRAAVLGLGRATDPEYRPTKAELDRMRAMVAEALDAGFAGLSTDRLRFSKLAGTRFAGAQLPSTYATWKEYELLYDVVRERGGVVQSNLDVSNRLETIQHFLHSAGGLLGRVRGRKPLKTSLLAALDLKSDRNVIRLLKLVTGLVNPLLGSDVSFQLLTAPFHLYSDGVDLVIFEEFASGTAALDIRDQVRRGAMMQSEEYRRAFRKDMAKKFGVNAWNRDFYDTEIVSCPEEAAVGKSFGQIADERGLQPVDVFLDLVSLYPGEVRWHTTVANDRPDVLGEAMAHKWFQFGNNDSGAHLRNFSFYNAPLRALKLVNDAHKAKKPFMSLETAVRRLTGELGEWYGLDAGRLRPGDRADIAVVDPAGLDDSLAEYHEELAPAFGVSRQVNRNDNAVAATVVGGRLVYSYGVFASGFGESLHAGQFLPGAAG